MNVQQITDSPPPTVRRRQSKSARREQLILATINSLAERGYAATTMAHVAKGAGLSQGIVNFHFESKEKLFLGTLEYLSDEYVSNWKGALVKAGPVPAKQLRALVKADLNQLVSRRDKVSAWFAFTAEAATKPAYQKLCWERDEEYLSTLRMICQQLKEEKNYQYDAKKVGAALYAIQEGFWMQLMLGGKKFKRKNALGTIFQTMGIFFPEHFNGEGAVL